MPLAFGICHWHFGTITGMPLAFWNMSLAFWNTIMSLAFWNNFVTAIWNRYVPDKLQHLYHWHFGALRHWHFGIWCHGAFCNNNIIGIGTIMSSPFEKNYVMGIWKLLMSLAFWTNYVLGILEQSSLALWNLMPIRFLWQ